MLKNNKEDFIVVKGARVNNLQNILVSIPRNKLTVITGLSGSGKSSLAFDTLYAEGQRRYVESLSAYARQFLGRINKPEVDMIYGLPPAIAIEQKILTSNVRSTVGTSTEIYEYLKLLFARIGKTISPISGKEVKKHSPTDVVNKILSYPTGNKIVILSPIEVTTPKVKDILNEFQKEGLSRVLSNGEIKKIDEIQNIEEIITEGKILLVIDRISVNNEDDFISRCSDSAQTALLIGKGICYLYNIDTNEYSEFSVRFESDGISFEEPSPHMFSFNNPLGACPKCQGYGNVIDLDPELIIPNKNLSVYDDAVVCWRGESFGVWKTNLINNAQKVSFPVHKPYKDLTDEQLHILWHGCEYFEGIYDFFRYLEEHSYKMHYRIFISRFRGRTICPECNGTRLRKDATYVKISDKSITDLINMQIDHLKLFFDNLILEEYEQKVAGRILSEIKNRLNFLINVGLGYLTLNRPSSTLSGGESQRINLSTALGSSLVGSLYILDEPSIGLHSHDTHLLIKVLKQLRDLGNTVVVVEHDEEIIKSADYIIDIGPLAGRNGGKIVFQGTYENLITHPESLTASYLSGKEKINIKHITRKWNSFIELKGVREHNLKGFDVRFPLNVLTVVTGVSGSGKSTLIKKILYPALQRKLSNKGEKPGKHDSLECDIRLLTTVEFIDQGIVGKSSRSNPVIYIKAYDEIRELFAEQSKLQHYYFKAGDFSFNVEGGRCEVCKGEGIIRVEMQFMADVTLVCDNCKGKRFKDEILDVKYNGKNIYDILELTVDEAISFFGRKNDKLNYKIIEKLTSLTDVGLGYLKLGQSTSTLSGGEMQRLKLASYLNKQTTSVGPTLFIFDEPTTGLHFHDIKILLEAFNKLLIKGHSIIIIEHNMEIIKSADWIIDLGPYAGNKGGNLIFQGTPKEIIYEQNSLTGKYLKTKFEI